jgi:hypothetical protein
MLVISGTNLVNSKTTVNLNWSVLVIMRRCLYSNYTRGRSEGRRQEGKE